MKKVAIGICLVISVLLIPGTGSADVDFVLEINPLSYIISPDIDGFKTTNGVVLEELDGYGSLFPTLKAGIGFGSDRHMIDLLGGVGYLWNDGFSAKTYSADAFFRFKVDQRGIFTVGPHIGVIRFNPEWDGPSKIDLADETGWVVGVGFTVGSPKVAFSAALDYLSAEFDVTPQAGWTANENTLDISGFLIQLGVQFRF